MRAVVIAQFGGPEVLQIRELEEPRPAPDQILVGVRTVGLNRADILQRMGRHPAPAGVRPDIPGLEFAGEVERTGEKVTRFKRGDRVMGLLAGEGYSEKIVTTEAMALPVPDFLNFEEAAAIPEVFFTAYDGLRQLGPAPSTLLVHAVGSGVGHAILQLAKTAGSKVFGTSRSDEKLSRARELGLDVAINPTKKDFYEVVMNQTDGRGVEAIVDLVGGPYWEKNLASLAFLGRMILIGLTGGTKVETNLEIIMRKRLRILGTVLRHRSLEEKIKLTENFQRDVLPSIQAGKLRPVIDRIFPFEEVSRAHTYMQSNQHFGKIVLRIS